MVTKEKPNREEAEINRSLFCEHISCVSRAITLKIFTDRSTLLLKWFDICEFLKISKTK